MNDFEYKLLLHKAKAITKKDKEFNEIIKINYIGNTVEHYKSIARMASIRTILLGKEIGDPAFIINILFMTLVKGLVEDYIKLQDIPPHIQWRVVAMGCNYHKSEVKWRTKYTKAHPRPNLYSTEKQMHHIALTKLQALKPLIRSNPEAFTQRIKNHGSKLPQTKSSTTAR